MANGTPDPDARLWYEANCHCGTVKYRISLPDLSSHQVNCCNCSVCTKDGYLLVYPKPSEVEWLQGFETLKAYEFGHKRVTHRFCEHCGSSILIDFHDGEKLGVNVSHGDFWRARRVCVPESGPLTNGRCA